MRNLFFARIVTKITIGLFKLCFLFYKAIFTLAWHIVKTIPPISVFVFYKAKQLYLLMKMAFLKYRKQKIDTELSM